MARQFSSVSSRYGAPMGRNESPLGDTPRSVRLFRVRLDSGGYDDGGAYWGIGAPLWCALCDAGGRQFVRADSRLTAAIELQIPAANLKTPPRAKVARLRALQSMGQINPLGAEALAAAIELGF